MSAVVARRLSVVDLTYLAVEGPDSPMHVAVVATVDGHDLYDEAGEFRLADARNRIEARLRHVPELRRRLSRAGRRQVWIEDPDFRVERHVHQVEVADATDEATLFRRIEALLGPVMDRAYPLWRVWFLTGWRDRRVVVVAAIHHAVADGIAAVRLIGRLLDDPGDRAVPNRRPRVGPPPAGPRRVARTWRHVRGAPRTSLNAPVGPHRRLAAVRLDLADAVGIAHRHAATVNDLVLDLAAGGLRELLRHRGEPPDALTLRASIAVSDRTGDQMREAGNRSGVVVVRLPLGDPDPASRLDAIHAETTVVKREQRTATAQGLLALLIHSGLARPFIRHQHLTNLVVSDVTGPERPIRLLGAPVLDLVPVGTLSGNLTVTFLAFSYAGRLTIAVRADADRYPDLDVLTRAMESDWATLSRATKE